MADITDRAAHRAEAEKLLVLHAKRIKGPYDCQFAKCLAALLTDLQACEQERQRLEAGVLKAHDFVSRKGQAVNHDFLGCLIDGILNMMEGLGEAAKRRDAAEASLTALTARIAELETEFRERVRDYRQFKGVPCQSECSWHAEEFERWADLLTSTRTPEPK